MSWLSQYRAQARYNQWFNQKLYAASATLTDEERKADRGAFFKSIHRTLNHLVLTDSIWLLRFTQNDAFFPRDARGRIIPLTGLAQELYGDFDELSRQRVRLDAELIGFAHGLSEETLLAEFSYRTSTGDNHSHALWVALTHFFNHQTHHRGQVTTLLAQFGIDPGVTDMIALTRSEPIP
jgi:uncharacterized damage-inducible protein DinB